MPKFFILFLLFSFSLTSASSLIPIFPIQQEGFWTKLWRCNIHISCYQTKLGSTLTAITGTTKVSDLDTILTTNFTALNNDKIEVSTTTLPFLTTLINVTQLGVIASSTWRGSLIGTPYGGTGSSTLASNRVLLGNGSSPVSVVNGFGASGQFLTSNGEATAPTWQTSSVSLSNFYDWTGLHTFNGLSVGIGTTTASTTLSVQGNALVSGTTTTGNLVATSSLRVGNGIVTDLGRVFYSAFNKLLYADNTLASTTLSIQIPGGTLSTGNALVFDFYFDDIVKGGAHFYAEFGYGTASTTINISNGTSVGSGAGTMSLILSADGATNSQNLSVLLMFESKTAGLATASSHYRQATTTAMSQDSTTNKILNIVFNAPSASDTHIQAMQIIGKLYAR